jgi:GTP-binding protein
MPQDMNESGDLTSIFEAIIKYVPEPKVDNTGTFQMLVTTLDADNYLGKYVIGRINRGVAKPGLAISLVNDDGIIENTRIEKVFTSYGLKRQEVSLAECGDIVALTGVKNAQIGQTIADTSMPEPLPSIEIEKPTLKMSISANTSPFAGKEGKYVTGRQLLDRIKKELETNVSLHLESNEGGEFIVAGRGELHLSVFIENLRREGYEMQVGKPQVITKKIDGVEMERFKKKNTLDGYYAFGDYIKHFFSFENFLEKLRKVQFNIEEIYNSPSPENINKLMLLVDNFFDSCKGIFEDEG